jgi:hypothetical protein
MVTAASQLQQDKVVDGSAAKTKKVAMQPIQKADSSACRETRLKLHRQGTMARARDIFAELHIVRRENTDAAPPARDGHRPLLPVGRSLDGRAGKQDVISFPARNFGRCKHFANG